MYVICWMPEFEELPHELIKHPAAIFVVSSKHRYTYQSQVMRYSAPSPLDTKLLRNKDEKLGTFSAVIQVVAV